MSRTFTIRFRIKRNVFFNSYNLRGDLGDRFKPRRIAFGNRTYITRVRWRRWNGRVARGWGRLEFNSCMPNCGLGRIVPYRVRIKLYRIRRCGRRLQYTAMKFAYTGAKPAGLPRTHRDRFFC